MKSTISNKKLVLAAILTSGLALAISQSAMAETTPPAQPAPATNAQVNKASMPGRYQLDPATQKAHEKFLNDTVGIRKEITEKHAVMRALMNANTPDTTKISQMAGELFELREKLRVKAQEAGLPMGMMMGMGNNMDSMPCQGMGMGMGMGGGRHHRMMQP